MLVYISSLFLLWAWQLCGICLIPTFVPVIHHMTASVGIQVWSEELKQICAEYEESRGFQPNLLWRKNPCFCFPVNTKEPMKNEWEADSEPQKVLLTNAWRSFPQSLALSIIHNNWTAIKHCREMLSRYHSYRLCTSHVSVLNLDLNAPLRGKKKNPLFASGVSHRWDVLSRHGFWCRFLTVAQR